MKYADLTPDFIKHFHEVMEMGAFDKATIYELADISEQLEGTFKKKQSLHKMVLSKFKTIDINFDEKHPAFADFVAEIEAVMDEPIDFEIQRIKLKIRKDVTPAFVRDMRKLFDLDLG